MKCRLCQNVFFDDVFIPAQDARNWSVDVHRNAHKRLRRRSFFASMFIELQRALATTFVVSVDVPFYAEVYHERLR